ncbi:sulfate adenylyltransferase [Leptospirillum ferriphilum]|jgi:sulfate adenylyltransferase|uniref:Sulfate adenylyltransferase n=2 Tax=Leptospirillum TaxID=179 RepID=A0A094WCI7_9BACT|nr:sulfate adenylyltransferase [Leptospirillum ferriphilum]EDZ38372.1 MAG: Sulfate adenylyltransferase [Leptospirillum sp. Group II '5-way CG']KGA94205.1 Sulfate adenylyltransferase, dissimilatory-type [Leptospirillum ferriphilum]
MTLAEPHGGKLVSNVIVESERNAFLRELSRAPVLTLDSRELSDLVLLSQGGLSPLTGFMDGETYHSVIDRMRLPGGLLFPLPVVLSLPEDLYRKISRGDLLALATPSGQTVGGLWVTDLFERSVERESREVYKTREPAHPGVHYLHQISPFSVGGTVRALEVFETDPFRPQQLTPLESRRLFTQKGWNTVVGFQTRNPIHRAHEYIQKCALELVDGLFIHPLVGETKEDDVPASVRMDCYKALLSRYYPKERVVLGVFPGSMRYAGPREALFHALIRKNYGCTHFIVGRDHAGVGSYYGPFEAHDLLKKFDFEDLGIVPIFFDTAYYCRLCGSMASHKTCGHPEDSRILLSGTKVRALLREGVAPPPEMTRPEVAEILIKHYARRAEEGEQVA